MPPASRATKLAGPTQYCKKRSSEKIFNTSVKSNTGNENWLHEGNNYVDENDMEEEGQFVTREPASALRQARIQAP
jgi:hypothetical protein